MVRATPKGVAIDVRVIPRSSKTQIDGTRGGRLLVRVAAPPVDEAANEAVVALLADILDVPKRAVRIVAGERARQKRVAVEGISVDAARTRLGG
jgi:uncharacterized protein (TIGR00251 family)